MTDPLSIGLLFLVAALFAGVETALNSLRGSALESLFNEVPETRASIRFLRAWKSNPRKIRLGLMVVQNLTRLGALGWLVILTSNAMSESWHIFAVLGVAILAVLFFVDVVPRALAQNHPKSFVRAFGIAYWVFLVLRWPIGAVGLFRRGVGRVTGEDEDRPEVTEEDIEALIKKGGLEGSLDKEQEELLSSVFAFDDILVREVMVPRVETVAFDEGADLEHIFETIHEKGFSRYPVYEETVDRIIGMFYVKDMLPYLQGPRKESFHLRSYLREPYFVPETKPINELMRELQQHKVHIVVVVDEFGGTAGLATQEDIIEEVFGEIYDEHDVVEEPEIREIDSGRFDVDSRTSIRALEERLGVSLPDSTDYETVGGFLVAQAGCVPESGERIVWNNLSFTITDADTTRIKRVEIQMLPPAEEPEEGSALA